VKVLLDTNIILDAIARRKPFYKNAEEIFLYIAQEQAEGFITANSVTDIYFIARKTLSDTHVREALRYLFTVFSVVDVCGKDCDTALDLPVSDYEDAVIMICAEKAGVDFIISRDDDFIKTDGSVQVIPPAGFLQAVRNA
jgi:predicted nucleic acid-binding protein